MDENKGSKSELLHAVTTRQSWEKAFCISLDRFDVMNLRRGVEGQIVSKVEALWGNVEERGQTRAVWIGYPN
jgi:hypothetical protein